MHEPKPTVIRADSASAGLESRPKERVVAVTIVRAAIDWAQRSGVDRDDLVDNLRLLDEPDGFAAEEVLEQVWLRLAARGIASTFGLDAGSHVARGRFRALEYAIRTSATLADGLARLVTYQGVLGRPILSQRSSSEGLHIVFVCPFAGESVRFLDEDFALAILARIARDATTVGVAPARVTLQHAEPPDRSPYEAQFRAPVTFAADHSEVVFAASSLAREMKDADPVLCVILEGCMSALLGEVIAMETMAGAVRRAVSELLVDDATLQRIAAHLSMSPRAVQKKLAAEGTGFRTILEEVRRGLACSYLARPELSVADVGLLLGYSDRSAFVRAFRRWLKTTPARYRKTRQGAGEPR